MDSLSTNVNVASLMEVPISNWRPTLTRECNVYVFEDGYIAKPFNQIYYKFVSRDEAKEILVDNLYALLRIKYFKKFSENIDAHIKKIIDNFTSNLQTTLQKVSFNADDDCEVKKFLPNYCIAFRNGVYNFRDNKWLFKYDIYTLEFNSIKLYQYDYDYIITWFINVDFTPLNCPQTLEGLLDYYKHQPTLLFKLVYNMSFTITHKFDFERFTHLCEILGYTMLQSFCEKFVYLIGTGWNGKNSLFDTFTDRLMPKPSTFDLQKIEQDKYITSLLVNRHLNIMLESSTKPVRESQVIKSLTGTMLQSIISKRKTITGIMNCRFVFSANNKDKIKFTDNTEGFKRRINIMEFYYKWNADKTYLTKGDYYDVEFSNSLEELKMDVNNIITYIILGIYATKQATSNFTKQFEFLYNDWNNALTSDYREIKNIISNIALKDISIFLQTDNKCYSKGVYGLCSSQKVLLQNCQLYKSYDNMLQELQKPNNILNGQIIFVAVWIIRDLQFQDKPHLSSLLQTNNITTETIYMNNKYIKVKIENDRLKVL